VEHLLAQDSSATMNGVSNARALEVEGSLAALARIQISVRDGLVELLNLF